MEEPPICEFKNWDEFYPAALRYHQSTHHGDDMVIDRIETFRRYMSKDVIEYLDGFVRLHPRFNKNKVNTRQFWQGLDRLVGDNEMSSSEQRQLFWGALPETEQKRLVEYCHYFDPQDEIWEKQDSEVAKLCEQKLSRILEFSVIDESITLSNEDGNSSSL